MTIQKMFKRHPKSATHWMLVRWIRALTPICIWGACVQVFASPFVPGAPQEEPIAIVNATVHAVAQPPMDEATVLFEDGRIVAVGRHVHLPDTARVIDGQGKHVYPGLFCAGGQTGLVEINSIRATVDARETGTINPNVRVHVAVNPDSELIPVTRANGVLIVLSEPSGGLISGKSAILQLDGWTWEDMVLKPDVGLHVVWPRMRAESSSDNSAFDRLNDFFDQAEHYQQNPIGNSGTTAWGSVRDVDVRLEAMRPVLRGEEPLIVDANSAEEIQAAIAFATQRDLRLIIHGGHDALTCAALLKAHDIPVIVTSVYRLPRRRHEDYDGPYTLPARLSRAGIRFCIAAADRFSASNIRNLPYHAATSVAFGLPEDEAIKAITLYPAQILGVADRVGSIQTGRDATLIITDGSPLETRTHVQQAFIQGRSVDLSNRHQVLWQKYRQRYRRNVSNGG